MKPFCEKATLFKNFPERTPRLTVHAHFSKTLHSAHMTSSCGSSVGFSRAMFSMDADWWLGKLQGAMQQLNRCQPIDKSIIPIYVFRWRPNRKDQTISYSRALAPVVVVMTRMIVGRHLPATMSSQPSSTFIPQRPHLLPLCKYPRYTTTLPLTTTM